MVAKAGAVQPGAPSDKADFWLTYESDQREHYVGYEGKWKRSTITLDSNAYALHEQGKCVA